MGNELTVYRLSHLGIIQLPHIPLSQIVYGEAWVKGESFTKLAEGVSTAKFIFLAKRCELELPIGESVYKIISEGKDAKKVLLDLFFRPIKFEF